MKFNSAFGQVCVWRRKKNFETDSHGIHCCCVASSNLGGVCVSPQVDTSQLYTCLLPFKIFTHVQTSAGAVAYSGTPLFAISRLPVVRVIIFSGRRNRAVDAFVCVSAIAVVKMTSV